MFYAFWTIGWTNNVEQVDVLPNENVWQDLK